MLKKIFKIWEVIILVLSIKILNGITAGIIYVASH